MYLSLETFCNNIEEKGNQKVLRQTFIIIGLA